MNYPYCKIQYIKTGLPSEEDLIEEKLHKKDYFIHSKISAEERFETALLQLKSHSRSLTEGLLEVKLILVQPAGEEIFICSSKDGIKKNEQALSNALETDSFLRERELEQGYLRHERPIDEKFWFRLSTTEFLDGEIGESGTIEFRLEEFGGFHKTLETSRMAMSAKLNELLSYDPLFENYLQVRHFLVDKNRGLETEILLAQKNDTYDLSPALQHEICDKLEYEVQARANNGKHLIFGYRDLIWDGALPFLKQERGKYYPYGDYRVSIKYKDRKEEKSTYTATIDFEESGWGEDLFRKSREAKEFYFKRLTDKQSNFIPKDVRVELPKGDFFPDEVILRFYVGKRSYQLYHPNSKKAISANVAIEANKLTERRTELIETIPKNQKDYEQLKQELQLWHEIDYCYVVYRGRSFSNPANQRKFIHHNLLCARQAALDFYQMALAEESDKAIQQDVSLVLHEMRGDFRLRLRSTKDYTESFLESEKEKEIKMLHDLGYQISGRSI